MEFNLQPTLEDDSLILRPLAKEDFKDLFNVAADSLIWEQHQNKNRSALIEFTKFFNEGIASNGAFAIIDVSTKQIIGSSRYQIINEVEGIVEIGWSFLSRDFWGGNYNRRFKKLMVNHALEYYNQVIFYVNSKNYRSQKAMEKLGGRRIEDASKSWVLQNDEGITYVIDKTL